MKRLDNMPGIASSAPAVLIAHLVSVTSTLRVGSGGVMLPNPPAARDCRAVRDASHLGTVGHAGDVAIPLCGPCSSSNRGSTTTVTQAQATALLHGATYANVHTTKNANGEIRGQIVRTVH